MLLRRGGSLLLHGATATACQRWLTVDLKDRLSEGGAMGLKAAKEVIVELADCERTAQWPDGGSVACVRAIDLLTETNFHKNTANEAAEIAHSVATVRKQVHMQAEVTRIVSSACAACYTKRYQNMQPASVARLLTAAAAVRVSAPIEYIRTLPSLIQSGEGIPPEELAVTTWSIAVLKVARTVGTAHGLVSAAMAFHSSVPPPPGVLLPFAWAVAELRYEGDSSKLCIMLLNTYCPEQHKERSTTYAADNPASIEELAQVLSILAVLKAPQAQLQMVVRSMARKVDRSLIRQTSTSSPPILQLSATARASLITIASIHRLTVPTNLRETAFVAGHGIQPDVALLLWFHESSVATRKAHTRADTDNWNIGEKTRPNVSAEEEDILRRILEANPKRHDAVSQGVPSHASPAANSLQALSGVEVTVIFRAAARTGPPRSHLGWDQDFFSNKLVWDVASRVVDTVSIEELFRKEGRSFRTRHRIESRPDEPLQLYYPATASLTSTSNNLSASVDDVSGALFWLPSILCRVHPVAFTTVEPGGAETSPPSGLPVLRPFVADLIEAAHVHDHCLVKQGNRVLAEVLGSLGRMAASMDPIVMALAEKVAKVLACRTSVSLSVFAVATKGIYGTHSRVTPKERDTTIQSIARLIDTSTITPDSCLESLTVIRGSEKEVITIVMNALIGFVSSLPDHTSGGRPSKITPIVARGILARLAILKTHAPEKLVNRLADISLGDSKFQASVALDLLTSIARLGGDTDGIAQVAVGNMESRLDGHEKVSAEKMAGVIFSLAKGQVTDRELYDKACDIAIDTNVFESVSSRVLVSMLWGYAVGKVDGKHEFVIRILHAIDLPNVPDFHVLRIRMLLYAVSRLLWSRHWRLDQELLNFVQQLNKMYPRLLPVIGPVGWVSAVHIVQSCRLDTSFVRAKIESLKPEDVEELSPPMMAKLVHSCSDMRLVNESLFGHAAAIACKSGHNTSLSVVLAAHARCALPRPDALVAGALAAIPVDPRSVPQAVRDTVMALAHYNWVGDADGIAALVTRFGSLIDQRLITVRPHEVVLLLRSQATSRTAFPSALLPLLRKKQSQPDSSPKLSAGVNPGRR
ncbi:hypothetical protein DIPPA_07131 [Diplonema papillatum]|nr:hypothetical protein DIPPA_07131 [Diplonema papillatum]